MMPVSMMMMMMVVVFFITMLLLRRRFALVQLRQRDVGNAVFQPALGPFLSPLSLLLALLSPLLLLPLSLPLLFLPSFPFQFLFGFKGGGGGRGGAFALGHALFVSCDGGVETGQELLLFLRSIRVGRLFLRFVLARPIRLTALA